MTLDEFHARYELVGHELRARPRPAGARLPASGHSAPGVAGSGGAGTVSRRAAKEAVLSERMNAVEAGREHGPRKDGNARTLLPSELPPLPPRRGGHKREALIQRRIVMALRRAGYAALAINGEIGLGGRTGMLLQMARAAMGYENGTPDIVVVLPKGRTLWLEIKAPPDGQLTLTRLRSKARAGRLSDEQKQLHALMRDLGHAVAVARDEAEAVDAARRAGED